METKDLKKQIKKVINENFQQEGMIKKFKAIFQDMIDHQKKGILLSEIEEAEMERVMDGL